MKRKVTILIIDDENPKLNTRSLEISLNKICDPEVTTIYTRDVNLRKDDGSDHLDPDKLLREVLLKIENKRIDWIVTDFNLGEDYLDGIDLIREISQKRIFHRKNIILYSGNIERAIEKIIDENGNDYSKYGLIGAIKKLYDLPILYYEKRDDYKGKLIDVIRKNLEPSIDEEFINILHDHGDLIFNSCYPPFSGKKLKEIAEIIENNADERSQEWRKAILEQTIAYLIKVNE